MKTRPLATRSGVLAVVYVLLAGGAAVLGASPAGGGDNDPDARFRGAPTCDLAVTDVTWEAATKDYSYGLPGTQHSICR